MKCILSNLFIFLSSLLSFFVFHFSNFVVFEVGYDLVQFVYRDLWFWLCIIGEYRQHCVVGVVVHFPWFECKNQLFVCALLQKLLWQYLSVDHSRVARCRWFWARSALDSKASGSIITGLYRQQGVAYKIVRWLHTSDPRWRLLVILILNWWPRREKVLPLLTVLFKGWGWEYANLSRFTLSGFLTNDDISRSNCHKNILKPFSESLESHWLRTRPIFYIGHYRPT